MSLAQIKLVRFNLHARFSYLETDYQSIRSFLRAARTGDVTTVDQMLQDGMPVDVSGWNDSTALHLATANNRTDVIKHLLNERADVNRQDRGKDTPLHMAARNNNTETAQLLIDNRADISLKNYNNTTPLDEAYKGSEIESMLLQQSAP